MQILLKSPSYTVEPTDSIKQVKQDFCDKIDYGDINRVKFIYKGKELEDERTLEEYEITDNTVIHTFIIFRRP